MATATTITRDEMDNLLREGKGWFVVAPSEVDGVNEVVYRWKMADNVADKKGKPSTVWLQVYSSINPSTGLSHGVGSDAIRVCAVRTWPNGFKVGFIKAKRVHRVEGWRANLIERVRRVMLEANARIAGMPKAEPESKASGPMRKLVTLFKHAKKHLKKPKITFKITLDGSVVSTMRVTLKAAPDDGKNPGSVYVQTKTGWIGTIDKYGHFHKSNVPSHYEGYVEAVAGQLTMIAIDPAGALGAQGQASGNCCFCNKKLTTDESMAVGYGPVCAEHYGLPWGKGAAAEQAANGTHPWEVEE